MSALIIVGVYVVGWLGFATAAIRVLAARMDKCKGGYYCDHLFWGHWRGDGSVGYREAVVGSLAAIGWPLLWLPALALILATRKPTPRAMANRIAVLEREAGIR